MTNVTDLKIYLERLESGKYIFLYIYNYIHIMTLKFPPDSGASAAVIRTII